MGRHVTVTFDGCSRLPQSAETTFHRPAGSMTLARSAAIRQAQSRALMSVTALRRHDGGDEDPGRAETGPASGTGLVPHDPRGEGCVIRRTVVSEICDDVTYRVTLEVTIDLDVAARLRETARAARI